MSVPQKVLTVLGVVAAALAVGGLVGWFAAGPSSSSIKEDSPVKDDPKTSSPPKLVTSHTNRQSAVMSRSRLRTRRSQTNQVAVAGTPSPVAAPAEWENKIDTVLTADTDDSQKAKKILELLPQLPEEGQEEAAEHLANLLPDDQYAAAGQLLTNLKTSEPVMDVLMSDLLNRPNELKLPLLLEMARIPEHPRAEESKDFLELYLEKDYGADWGQWEQAMKAWLKENPD
jgi:hypothetical protein